MNGSNSSRPQASRVRTGRLPLIAAVLFGSVGAAYAADATPPPAPSAVVPVPTSALRPPVSEAAFGAFKVRVRPSHAQPGHLVEIEVQGPATEATVRLGTEAVPMFPAGSDLMRGYAAVPVDQAAGDLAIAVDAASGSKRVQGEVKLAVDDRPFPERTLRVDRKFTSPSKAHRARMKADKAAFANASRLPFGPPLFSSNFLNPRAGAELNARYGEKRVFNGKLQSRHMGLDLDGRTGDPIFAANDGVVRMVRNCFAAGNAVVIAHGAGIFTSYFHLSRFDVKVGQQVKKGDLIGLVGKTGRVTGPHLHLSSKVNSTSLDPESLFAFDFFPGEPINIAAGGGGEAAAPVEPGTAAVR